MISQLEKYFDRLWPICRSITGNGLRDSLKIVSEIVPIETTEVPTGTQVFDWVVPKEWNINDAYIIAPSGEKICDFKVNNLHVVNYAIAVDKKISLEELKKHLYSIPEMPDAIPYITSYYSEKWGFCIAHNELLSLEEGEYTVFIDSTLKEGSLTYGEAILKGDSDREVLFSTYLCHPSMANNELSGPLVQAFLYQKIATLPKRKYTYRFLFAPETIGVIAYLHKYGMQLKEKLDAGYVLTCCGDEGDFVYKQSKRANTSADKAAKHVLKNQARPYSVIPFSVGGSDERQYCSPGFNLPVGSLTRSMYQRYKEYHTSLDNKSFVSFDAMEKTVNTYFDFVRALELNEKYLTTIPYCEPQLGKRGLYPSSTEPLAARKLIHDRMHFLTYADGEHDLIDIAELKGISIFDLEEHIAPLLEAGLIKEA